MRSRWRRRERRGPDLDLGQRLSHRRGCRLHQRAVERRGHRQAPRAARRVPCRPRARDRSPSCALRARPASARCRWQPGRRRPSGGFLRPCAPPRCRHPEAVMAPRPTGTAALACPLSLRSRAASEREKAPAAARAEFSPSDSGDELDLLLEREPSRVQHAHHRHRHCRSVRAARSR